MKELSQPLEQRCRELLSRCVEFDTDESMRNSFDGVVKQYSRFVHEKNTRDERIRECIRGFKDRSSGGKSILALYLDELSERYPEFDDTGVALKGLAGSILLAQEAENGATTYSPQQVVNKIAVHQDALEIVKQEVLVIWGQNDAAKIEVFGFLKGAGFSPVDLGSVVVRTGKNAPSANEVLHTAFATVQAVVIVFTGDDMAVSKGNLKREQELSPQPRADLLFIAGVAAGINADRTIVVALGKLRPFADLLGRHVMLLTNKQESRNSFMTRLQIAGCRPTMSDWTIKGDFLNPSFYKVPHIEIKAITTDFV